MGLGPGDCVLLGRREELGISLEAIAPKAASLEVGARGQLLLTALRQPVYVERLFEPTWVELQPPVLVKVRLCCP